MKIILGKLRWRWVGLVLPALAIWPGTAAAQYFTFGNGDLVAGFRKPNVGTYELVVNVGNVSNFLAQPIGTVIPIAHLSPSQLSNAFSSFSSLQWSVSAQFYGAYTTWDGFPADTIWYTVPRLNPGTPTPPPARISKYGQAPIRQSIYSMETGASDVGGSLGATNAYNNTYLVTEPVGGPYNTENYSVFVADPNDFTLGDFNGNLPFSVENTTPSPFSAAAVSDLYQSVPGGLVDPTTGTNSGPADYIGYFTLNPDGTMTFTRSSPSAIVVLPPPPQIVSVARANDTTTIDFATTNGPTYTLYFTNSAGLTAPVSTWPALSTTVVGNGQTNSFSDTTTDATRFYRIGVH